MEYPIFEPGYVLKEDEYLLKIREDRQKTGFMTKFNKDGSIPVAFSSWEGYSVSKKFPVYVIKETFRAGWKLLGWRIGKSQQWARVVHPDGFVLEIYLDQLSEIIETCVIDKGTIVGKFKWSNNRLIKEEI